MKKRSATIDQKQILIFEAARLCYDFDLSQREVAESLGLSPATLTRFLKRAKDLGIIKISVQPPEGYVRDLESVSAAARERLGIAEVIVTPSSSHSEIVRKEIGFAAARWVMDHIAPGMRIGFSGGRTVAAVVPFLKPTEAEVRTVQLMGGLSPDQEGIQSDVIARSAAAHLGGRCTVIHGPALFPDGAALKGFLENRIIGEAFADFDRLGMALIGVGTPSPENPLIRNGWIDGEEVAALSTKGYVGDICCHFFNQSGKECLPALARRVLGIQLEQLARVPEVCAVAAGAEKTPALFAAARAGIIKTLITDLRTAEELVKL